MWLELGNMFINTDHLVRVEFLQEPNKFTATLITVKPGGCDRTFVYDEDARKVKDALEKETKPVDLMAACGIEAEPLKPKSRKKV